MFVPPSENSQMGYVGNVWVKTNFLPTAGMDNGGGHFHYFDHVSLLVAGKVLVEVEGHPPKEFTAPTFIVIKKEHKHKFTALEDNTMWYCVFALRDIEGNVADFYSGDNSPYTARSDKYEEYKTVYGEATTKEI